MPKLNIVQSTSNNKKFNAVFTRDDGTIKIIPFGDSRYEDFTQHHDRRRRELYILRHKENEDWNEPQTAGSLSRFILWGNSTDIQKNINAFKNRFGYS
jgi:hypothetical protein